MHIDNTATTTVRQALEHRARVRDRECVCVRCVQEQKLRQKGEEKK